MAGGDGTTKTNLERLTTNLVPRAAAALKRIVDRTGYNKSDAVNRAVLMYDHVLEVEETGGHVYTRGDDGEYVRMFFL